MNMLQHYIKIALRNLLKYKLQSIISIIGLAIGFICFALATLWIQYEQTYDTFHEGADRLYLLRDESNTHHTGLSSVTPFPLSGYLKATFPEVEDACYTRAWETQFRYKGANYPSFEMQADSATMRLFQLHILEGNLNFLEKDSKEIAITDLLARQLFGTKNPLGEELEIRGKKKRICAIVQSWSLHSNFPFEIVGCLDIGEDRTRWSGRNGQTFMKLKKGVDQKAFIQKLYEHTYTTEGQIAVRNTIATPITTMRYDRPDREVTVKYEHIMLFALAGALVILCSLFNYLTLFVTRIRMRGKEIALRKVNGSSNRNLLILFSVEYMITLLLALFTGLVLMELIIPAFKELSGIKLDSTRLFLEVIQYSGMVAGLSFLLSLYPIYYFRRKTLNAALKGSSEGKGRNSFQQIGMMLQLIISIGFIFCSTILMKQIHHLNHTDLGITRSNRGYIGVYPSIDGLKDELAKIPCIAEILQSNLPGLLPRGSHIYQTINEWEGINDSTSMVTLEIIDCDTTYLRFFGLSLLKGTFPPDDKSILINETAAKELKMDEPIGKTIQGGDSKKVITGIIKDFYIAPPTIPAKPMMFTRDDGSLLYSGIIFRYQNSEWPACKQRIEQLIKKMNPNIIYYTAGTMEEEYQKFLQSENALLLMLDFVTLVCVLISLFGVFSLVTLDCEQRRKEIAIRKVNGALTKSIMLAFFRRYMLLLAIASAVAFPIGYLIMKSWIENYALQTSIDCWIYPAIWFSLALLIILCTGWQIARAANQNPAETIKSE